MIGNKEYRIIKKSGLFDEAYYLRTYDDVRKSDIDPIKNDDQINIKGKE